jgi:hypothetical protein
MTASEIRTQIVAVEAEIAARKARKKGTATLRENLAQLQVRLAEAETTEAPKRRGRPRKYNAEYYELRNSLKRTRRGRPSREQVIADLEMLKVAYDPEATTRTLELLRKQAVRGAIKLAK